MFKQTWILAAVLLLLSPALALAGCNDDLADPTGPWDQARNQKLINLVIENGIDFRPGDKVFVAGDRYQTPFIEAVVEELKRRGAGSIRVFKGFVKAETKAAILSGESPEAYVERHLPKKLIDELVQEKYATISIAGSNFMGVPEGVTSEDWAQFQRATAVAYAPFGELAMSNIVPWTVIELPTPLLAGLVAPELPADQALATLKKMMADVYLLDAANTSALWRQSSQTIEARGAKLNALGIKKLHYQSPDTDFTIELHARARWQGGRVNSGGRIFQSNFPSFENFVSPMSLSTNGHVKVQRPVPVQNTLVRGAWFKFEKGQVVSYGADEGLEALDRFFNQDPRNRFVGEVALVDDDSPVNRQERPFYSILFDENALSHIALGAAYPTTFTEPYPASEADYEAVQMNSVQTLGHTDFMIGSPQLNITAETYGGQKIPIMINGKIQLTR